MPNDITVTILDDGTVRIDTGAITGPDHQAAEAALLWIQRELGGPATRTRRIDIGAHIHEHEHEHTHQ
jgi:hypothetical protein